MDYDRMYYPAMSSLQMHLDEEPTPYEEGYLARLDGVPRFRNPYPVLTDEYDAWEAGHRGDLYDGWPPEDFDGDDWDEDAFESPSWRTPGP